jgi:CheY-like chemotaxis protein
MGSATDSHLADDIGHTEGASSHPDVVDGQTRQAARRSILVVEDDTDARELLGAILEEAGYHVVLMTDGAAALRYLRGDPPPCCILLDVWMPVMGGIAFRMAQQRDKELAAIPVIVLSAHRRGPHLLAEIEATAYLEKPFTPDQILTLVKQVGC